LQTLVVVNFFSFDLVFSLKITFELLEKTTFFQVDFNNQLFQQIIYSLKFNKAMLSYKKNNNRYGIFFLTYEFKMTG